MLSDEEKEELKKLGVDLDELPESVLDEAAEDEDDKEESEAEDQEGEKEEQSEEKESEEKEEKAPESKSERPSLSDSDAVLGYMRRLEERVEELAKASQKPQEKQEEKQEQKPAREPQFALTDVHLEEIQGELAGLKKQLTVAHIVAKRQEQNLEEAAYARVKEKYPDFDKYITPERRELARNTILGNLDKYGYGIEWEKEYIQNYEALSHADVRRERDELRKKRDEKKEKEKRPVAKVLPSGSSFQSPQEKTGGTTPTSYRDLRGPAARILQGE